MRAKVNQGEGPNPTDALETTLSASSEGKYYWKRSISEKAGLLEPKAKVARMSEAQLEENKIVLNLCRAPVARM